MRGLTSRRAAGGDEHHPDRQGLKQELKTVLGFYGRLLLLDRRSSANRTDIISCGR